MKTLYILLLVAFLSAITSLLQANPTNKDDALKIAQRFYSETVLNGLRSSAEFQLVYSETGKVNNNKSIYEFVSFYVFNAGDNEGFVIVSGDDAVKPILAYSDEGSFPAGKIPANLKAWLDYYNNEITYVLTNPKVKTIAEPILETGTSLRSVNSAVAPLLGNIRWNQDDPFNLLCPISTTYSEITVTGCIATAMAQVMKYYEWPTIGISSKSYTFDLDGVSTTLSANFGQTTYKWNNMLDSYGAPSTLAQDTAAALLSYHCGVSVGMDFGTASHGGSGATMTSAGIALKTYFNYDPDIQSFNRDYFDLTTWTQKLMTEINAGRPVFYSGSSDVAGHAFVCDGYDNDGLFHINWGWGGYANGYFVITALNPDYPGIGSSTGGYSQDQRALFGIQKNDGVDNHDFNLCLKYVAMTSSTSSISDISSELFSTTQGFANFGLNTFGGNVGVGLYRDGLFIKYLQQVTLSSLPPNYGVSSYTFSNMSLNGLAEGSYKIYLVYKPTGTSTWIRFYGNETLNNHLLVTIAGSTATITVPSAGNNVPVANAGPDQTVDEGTTVTLNGSASSDPDGNALTYLWTAPSGITLSSATAVNPTFTAPQVTIVTQYTFSLAVNDGTVNSAADQVVITVRNVNIAPVANAGPDQIVNEGAIVTLDGTSSSDADGNTLSYLWTAPTGITLSSVTAGNPTFTAPEVLADTQYNFSLVVNDGTVNSPSDLVIITVKQVNKEPVANAGPDQTVDEGTTVTLNGSASSDPDGNTLTYLWTAPAGITLSSVTASNPTFTAPEVLSDTQYNFSLVVNDGTVNSPSDLVIITVKQVNKVPVANAGTDQTVDEGTTVTLNGSASSDPDGNTLTYLWTAPAGITLSSVTASNPTFTAPEVLSDTQYNFSLVVNDGTVNSPSDLVIITVKQVNKEPVANAGPDQTVDEGTTVTLNGSASEDPDGNTLTYLWTAPSGITLSSTTASNPTFTAPEVLSDTQYNFSLVVNDGTVNSTADLVVITVKQVNKVPVANAGTDQTVDEGTTVTLNGSASEDPDGNTLTYLWTAPSGITLSSVTASNPTFTAPEVLSDTQYNFSLVVNDGTVNSTADLVVITVKQVNKVPVANAGPDQTVNEGAIVTLDGTGSSDPDGNTLTYLWTAPAGITLSSATASKPTFTTPDVTTNTQYIIGLVVNDGTVNSPADQVVITVNFVIGLKQINDAEVVQIFPNPAEDIVYLRFKNQPKSGTKVSLYDVSGKEILKQVAVNKEELINLSNFPAGTYFIRIDQLTIQSYKIVKK